ncbi:S8 family serine peptidase [Candidatus Solincola tengchongensis]|uniref:S8 family serine peptidase n=1 Tax=Candidatus Solincola tengchongensis TaxID=2900693 RepID=UPI002580EB02|nr:S8 family serine peptidase [Candidatus Solincola tengchongensis]
MKAERSWRGRVTRAAAFLLVIILVAAGLALPVSGGGRVSAGSPVAGKGGETLPAAKAALLKDLNPHRYPAGSYLPGEVAVELSDPTLFNASRLLGAFSSLLGEDPAEVLSRIAAQPVRRVLRLRLRAGLGELEACRRLLSSSLVRTAEPNLVFRAAVTTPNDPRYPQQWNLWDAYGVNADAAWDLQRGSSSLTLAVIDTGIDFSHSDLAGRILSNGYDYVNGDPYPADDDGHGTMVAGIACANGNNLRGIAGIDWYAGIMPVKALNRQGQGSLDAVVNSVYHAANHGASVINMSFTSSTYSKMLQDAVEYAHALGCVMAAAAGNEGTTLVDYPAGLTYVIGVGSVGQDGKRSYFSNHNGSVDLVAPGEGIWGTDLGDSYSRGSGTSEATPHVSAAALLVLAEYPGSTPEEVWRRLRDGARDLGTPGYDEEYGWGLLDLFASLRVPLVSVTSPEDYSYPASGKVSADASSANVAIKYLELWVDGELEETYTLPTASYSVSHTFSSWDLSGMREGTHEVSVKAVDGGGTVSGEHSVTVFRNTTQPQPAYDWYLAEGCTAFGFEEYVLVQNPNPSPVDVEVTFMRSDGPTPPYTFPMAAHSRLTVNVNALVPGSEASTKVHATGPVVAERAMYWGGRTDGHASTGASAAFYDWYLAEGCTAFGFEEYVLVQNPNPSPVDVEVTFMRSDGPTPPYTFPMAAHSRLTVNVNALVPGSEVSTKVHATGPVVAERAMYWGGRDGGHGALGVPSSSISWYLAEGCTAFGFEEFVLIQNPNPDAAAVILDFRLQNGTGARRTVSVEPGARKTVNVADVVPGNDVSVFVRSDVPVVAERAMYWPCESRSRAGGHASPGSLTAAGTWYLAEGSTAHGFEEYVLLYNASGDLAHAVVTFMRTDGTTRDHPVTIPAGARYTVSANDVDPGRDASVRVSSSLPLVVERAMYWSSREGGTAAVGALQP